MEAANRVAALSHDVAFMQGLRAVRRTRPVVYAGRF